MKSLKFTTTLLLFLLILSAWSFYTYQNEKSKPKIYQVGNVKITEWTNLNPDSTSWKNYKVEKFYQKDGETKSTNYYNKAELLLLKEAIDQALKSDK